MKYSKISFSLKLLDVVVCFDLSEDILETDQLRKWYEDWKREAIGRWERNALSCCQVGSSLIKAEVRTPLRLAKSYPSRLFSGMSSALCFIHLLLSASLTGLALNRLSDYQLTSDTTTFAVPLGDQHLKGAQRQKEQELVSFFWRGSKTKYFKLCRSCGPCNSTVAAGEQP